MAKPARFAQEFLFTARAVPTDDTQLTCFICNQDAVTHEMQLRGEGRRIFVGIHIDCAERAIALGKV
jgi:hypothetical protein